MRKVVLGLAVSLDGFIEGPNGEYDWCFTDQDYGMSEFMKRIDAIIMGRKSFEIAQKYEGENPWKGVLTYVVSNTLKKIDQPDTKLISGDLRNEIDAIKRSDGKDIWLFGGAELTTFFINEQLIDEYWLAVHPIILGSGKQLFNNIDGRKKLKLLDQRSYSTGLVSLRYATDHSK
jgi:dihydrofolate reductase